MKTENSKRQIDEKTNSNYNVWHCVIVIVMALLLLLTVDIRDNYGIIKCYDSCSCCDDFSKK